MLHHLADILVSYGAWGILLLSVLDSAGVPLPAALDFLLIGVAAASAKTPSYAYFCALLAVAGSVGGNLALFTAARQGRRLFGTKEPVPGQRRRFREWFHEYGLLTIFVPAVTPVVPLPLKVFVVSAGALHAPTGRFLLVILVARSIRYFGEAYLGLQLGADAQGFLARNGWGLALGALVLVAAFCAVVRLGRRRDPVV